MKKKEIIGALVRGWPDYNNCYIGMVAGFDELAERYLVYWFNYTDKNVIPWSTTIHDKGESSLEKNLICK